MQVPAVATVRTGELAEASEQPAPESELTAYVIAPAEFVEADAKVTGEFAADNEVSGDHVSVGVSRAMAMVRTRLDPSYPPPAIIVAVTSQEPCPKYVRVRLAESILHPVVPALVTA